MRKHAVRPVGTDGAYDFQPPVWPGRPLQGESYQRVEKPRAYTVVVREREELLELIDEQQRAASLLRNALQNQRKLAAFKGSRERWHVDCPSTIVSGRLEEGYQSARKGRKRIGPRPATNNYPRSRTPELRNQARRHQRRLPAA